MGCDIHIMAEVKENGEWRKNTDPLFKNPFYSTNKKRMSFQEDEYIEEPSSARRYDWFAILADIRNGYGFAGVSTGSGFDVISECNGVPHDACEEWQQYVSEWQHDMHSESYLDISDFDKFNFEQVTMKSGVISLSDYKKVRGTGDSPSTWSGGIHGGNTATVDEHTADRILTGENIIVSVGDVTKASDECDIHVQYNWTVLYREWFSDNIEDTVEPLRKLAEKYDDARIVFGFDN